MEISNRSQMATEATERTDIWQLGSQRFRDTFEVATATEQGLHGADLDLSTVPRHLRSRDSRNHRRPRHRRPISQRFRDTFEVATARSRASGSAVDPSQRFRDTFEVATSAWEGSTLGAAVVSQRFRDTFEVATDWG